MLGAGANSTTSGLLRANDVSVLSGVTSGVKSSLAFVVNSTLQPRLCRQYLSPSTGFQSWTGTGLWTERAKPLGQFSALPPSPSLFPSFAGVGITSDEEMSPSASSPCLITGFGEHFIRCLQLQPALTRRLAVLAFSFVGGVWTGGAALCEEVIVSDGGDANQNLLNALFLAAFFGLAVLTCGVIYLSVTDFMEKRQRNEMEKTATEEAKLIEESEAVKVRSAKGFGVKKVEKKVERKK